jgi:hypothetical protein
MMMSRVGDDSDDNNIWSPPTSIASDNSNDDICVERRGLEDEQWLLVEGGDHSRGVSWLTIIILERIFFVWSRNVFLHRALRRRIVGGKKKEKTAQLRQNGVKEINRDVPRPRAIWSKLADVTPGFMGYSDI